MEEHKAVYISPIGAIEIVADETAICAITFLDDVEKGTKTNHAVIKECIYQLEEYFNGIRKEFGIPLRPKGTEFQQQVWNELQKIPFGKTSTYLNIAKSMGDANATRAVGNANGKNPIAILVPCHRVIGVNGKLVGYSGGIWRKDFLLHLEKNSTFGKQTSLF